MKKVSILCILLLNCLLMGKCFINPSIVVGLTEDGGIIRNSKVVSVEGIVSLDVDTSIQANLAHNPVFNIQSGDTINIENTVNEDQCSIILTIEDISDELEGFLEPIVGGLFPINIDFLNINLDYDTISDEVEGVYPLPVDLSLGLNTFSLEYVVPVVTYTVVLTFQVNLVLYVQIDVSGNAEILGDDYLTFTSYRRKTMDLSILDIAEVGNIVYIESTYGVTISNIVIDIRITGDAIKIPLLGTILVPELDESENLVDIEPDIGTWYSNDKLNMNVEIGKSQATTDFQIIYLIPVFIGLYSINRKRRLKI